MALAGSARVPTGGRPDGQGEAGLTGKGRQASPSKTPPGLRLISPSCQLWSAAVKPPSRGQADVVYRPG